MHPYLNNDCKIFVRIFVNTAPWVRIYKISYNNLVNTAPWVRIHKISYNNLTIKITLKSP